VLSVFPVDRQATADPADEVFPPIAQNHSHSPANGAAAGSAAEGARPGSALGDLQAENERLKEQLDQAMEAAGKWRAMHEQLHSFCMEQLLPGASTL
jgi:hypothetical protein